MFCSLIVTPVSVAKSISNFNIEIAPHATNYFTGRTGTMNTVTGSQSKIFNASSGSISAEAIC